MASVEDPVPAIQQAAGQLPGQTRVVATTEAIHAQIKSARQIRGQSAWWCGSLAAQLEAEGQLDKATQVAQGQLPAGWLAAAAGELGMILGATRGRASDQPVGPGHRPTTIGRQAAAALR